MFRISFLCKTSWLSRPLGAKINQKNDCCESKVACKVESALESKVESDDESEVKYKAEFKVESMIESKASGRSGQEKNLPEKFAGRSPANFFRGRLGRTGATVENGFLDTTCPGYYFSEKPLV